MTKLFLKLALLVLLPILTGCSSNYNCKGLPEGVNCKSAREVYNATEGADYLGTNAKGATFQGMPNLQQVASLGGVAEAVQSYRPDGPIPIRTPEKLMLIWVGPWEDSEGSLHMPTIIYTEIESRKWVMGERIIDPQTKLTPLDVRSRAANEREDKHRPPTDLSELTLNHPLKGE